MRDLDFLRDDHHAPIAYDDSRKGFQLTGPTFRLAPLALTRREAFTFSHRIQMHIPSGLRQAGRVYGSWRL